MGPEPGVSQNGDDDDADAEDGVDDEGRRDEADEKLPEGRGRPQQFESKVQRSPVIILCLGKAVLENTSFMSC